jgi:MFS family permease
MGLCYAQLGALGFGNLLIFALASILAGPLTDRFGPRKAAFLGVTLWSLATVGSALAPGFWTLLVMRALVGVGEGAFGPSANALLCATAPPGKRGRAMGIYNVGMAFGGAVGGGLGIAVSGPLGEYVTWRSALLLTGAPGLLFAIAALFMAGPEHVERDVHLKARKYLLAPTYLISLAGGAIGTFGCSAMIAWCSTVLTIERQFSANFAGAYMFAVALICGGGGVFAGGHAGDALNHRMRGGHALTIGIGFMLAFPTGIAALFAPGPVSFCILTAVVVFFLSVYNGPVAAIVDELGPRQYGATLQAWFLLGIHLLGNTPAPVATGFVADKIKPYVDRPVTFALVPAFAAMLVSGLLFVWVARRQFRGK